MTTSWDEIKRLAADFQRVQLVESSYKLSERNCIEIINKLIDLGMLNVLHSIDGKDFVTHKHLEKEIYDELYVHDGRINIVKLQTLLNIDVSYIETKVSEIVKHDPNLHFILGQIISKDYMNKMAEDISELLQDRESIELSELISMYELPGEFMQEIIKPRMGTLIKGNFDGKILYTHNYVNSQRSNLAGVLEACIKPVRLSQLVKDYNIDSGLIIELFDELVANGTVKGSLFGSRQVMSAVFVPFIFTKAQQQYVASFFKQNGYLEYGSLKKVGITDSESYVKSLFADQDIKYLSSSCFSSYFLDRIEQEIEDGFNRNGYADLTPLVPSNLSSKDVAALTSYFEVKMKSTTESIIMSETYLVSKSFLKSLQAKFQAKMEEKSKEELKRRNVVLAFKTDHAIIGGGSSNSTTTSAPTKGGKSKGKKGASSEPVVDESLIEILFLDRSGLVKELKSMVEEIEDDLVESLVEHLLKPLNSQYFDLLKSKVESGLINTSTETSSGDNKSSAAVSPKKAGGIKEVQEKAKQFLVNAKIFEKSAKLFTDNKIQDLLSKHLIKTVCSEITNEMLRLIATEQMIQVTDENWNTDSRLKIIQKLKEPHKKGFTELNQAMTNRTFGEVIEIIEKVAVESLELSVKKADPKREKETILQLRENTKSTLETEKDPATVLHLTSTLLFYHVTGQILNAPGRCVPNILEFVRDELVDDAHNKLVFFQNLIIESLSKSKGEEGTAGTIDASLVDEIRSIGLNGKNFVKNSKIKN